MTTNATTLLAAKTVDGSIKSWINNSTVPSTDILTDAENFIYDRLRVRQMLSFDVSLAFSVSDSTLTMPTDYRSLSTFRITGVDAADLRKKLPKEVEAAFSYDSDGNRVNVKPEFFYEAATTFEFDNPSDKVYPTRLVYFAALAALTPTSNETNFLTDRYSRLLRATCLAFANEFLKDDDEKNHWLVVAENQIDEINAQADMDLIDLEWRVTAQ